MRKHVRTSNDRRGAASRTSMPTGRRRRSGRGIGPDEQTEAPLTRAQGREIERRIADLRDPIRYVLVVRMAPRFSLFYNVSDDVYAMKDPSGATLFKRRKAAEAIKRTLGRGVQVLECRTKLVKGARVPVLSSRESRPRKT